MAAEQLLERSIACYCLTTIAAVPNDGDYAASDGSSTCAAIASAATAAIDDVDAVNVDDEPNDAMANAIRR